MAVAGMMALAMLGLALPAAAVQPRSAGDPHIYVVDYDSGQVVELKGVLGFQMTVEFDPDEHIENVALGDSLGWQVTPNKKANLLFLKPMSQRPATNMTVITNLRRYNFRLTTAAGKAAERRAAYAVRFVYAEPVVAVVEAPPPPAPPMDRNHAYTYQGSDKVVPQRLFDDGQATYFAFRRDADLPAIFAVDLDGQEAAVNTFARDEYLVVDRVAPGFVLRRGKETTRVYNDNFKLEPPGPLSPKARPKDPWWRR